LVSTGYVFADPHISARVSANETSLNNSITLSVEVSGVTDLDPPRDLNIPDFEI